jgi:solute carrier family 35 protein F5
MERSREREHSLARSLRSVRTLESGTPLSRADYAAGVVLLLVVVILWTASNYVTQALFQEGFEKPFLMTYLNTSSFSLYLIPFIPRYLRRNKTPELASRSRLSRYESVPIEDSIEGAHMIVQESMSDSILDVAPLTTHQTSNLALEFCFLWFLANWTLNASLAHTSVASVTVLTSMSGFFTLALGRLVGVEVLNLAKVVAVAVSFTGVVLVSLSDSKKPSIEDPSSPDYIPASLRLWGDCFALLSAVFYALYVILLKVRIKSESRIDMQLFFGFVGLYNVLLCSPFIVILHMTRMEQFGLPSSGYQTSLVLANMLITLSSDYIYVLAMLKTTPLVATVGLSLTIPFAVFGDFFLGHPATGQVVLGAILVFSSFVVVGLKGAESDHHLANVTATTEDEDIYDRSS